MGEIFLWVMWWLLGIGIFIYLMINCFNESKDRGCPITTFSEFLFLAIYCLIATAGVSTIAISNVWLIGNFIEHMY
jgi:hypothetical protein